MMVKKVALVGNPNVGKSSLFNLLTGLRQKIGNYPGMTVEKKTGYFLHQDTRYEITDLPGTYGIYPNSLDEQLVTDVLNNPEHLQHPELVLVVTEPEHLRRGILLYHQVRDLEIPAVFVINMIDEAEKNGILIDVDQLQNELQTEIICSDARTGKGIDDLKKALTKNIPPYKTAFEIPDEFADAVNEIKNLNPKLTDYKAWQSLSQKDIFFDDDLNSQLESIKSKYQIIPKRLQVKETLQRHALAESIVQKVVLKKENHAPNLTEKIDNFLIHPFWGYVIFIALLLLIFQAVFAWSGPFMDGIENGFAWCSEKLGEVLPNGPLTSLLTDGIIAGIGGIVIFIPQIVILFFFISLMEESGYMSRVVYLMDRWLKPFGLSGKSAVPLMSGAACAIPAVMSARNIENDKERLITILVTPFMTCSARLPIYVIIIGLIIPNKTLYGFNMQGITLFGMYVLGVLGALGSAWILKKFIHSNFKSYLILELPTYKVPVWRNVLLTVWEKSSGFILGAGKIILAISIVLWVLGSFGFSKDFKNAEKIVSTAHPEFNENERSNAIASYKLEHSILGNMGRAIEPIIQPLGYDWKMGIGLISSFAAREVFVATMATVYSLGNTDDELTVRSRMAGEVNENTGKPAYNFASGVSLLLFYAFAMQCMSTIAVVKRETGTWKWPMIQLVFMTGLAYLSAWMAYQFLN